MTIFDRPINWTKRNPIPTVLFLFACMMIVMGLSIQQARESYDSAKAQSKSAKRQSQDAKTISNGNRRLIETLIANGEKRRNNLDHSRYNAALGECRRQNVARAQGNELALIVKTALSTLKPRSSKIADKLIALSKKVHYTKLTDCLEVVPNPAQLDPDHHPTQPKKPNSKGNST